MRCATLHAENSRRIYIWAVLALVLSLGMGTACAQSKLFPGQLGSLVEKGEPGTVRGVTFRVWAPQAETVAVIGAFNNWDATRNPLKKENGSGLWSIDVRTAKPGDEYLYLINGKLERRDPRARLVSKDEKKSVIYDTAAFNWGGADKFQSSALMKDLVVYQLHPGTFYDPNPKDDNPGTLRDAINKLDTLKEMGVNAILLMPVNEFPGRHSWGYNPSDLFAVENAYGGPDALKEFVKAAHQRGIAVHLDIVHNHYGPTNLDLWQFDGSSRRPDSGGIYFYEDERGKTPWGPRPNFGRPEVRQFIADQVRMWFDEYKIDGLRWDSTVNIRATDNGAQVNKDGERLLQRISQMIRQEFPGKISIAEDSVGDSRFDASWEYAFHHGDGGGVVPELVKSSDADRDVADIARRITSKLGFRRVIYTENHDETGKLNDKHRNVTEADAADPHSLLARRKHALAAVVTLTSPGVPLVFMGQELLEDKDFHDDSPLNWKRGTDAFHAFQLYKDLVHLRRNLDRRSAALTGTHLRMATVDNNRKLLAYRRYLPGHPEDDIFVVINFSGQPVKDFPLTFPQAGEWKILFNTDNPKYGTGFTDIATAKLRTDSTQKIAVSLAPYSSQIFGLSKLEPPVINLEEEREQWDLAQGEPSDITPESPAEVSDHEPSTGPQFVQVSLQSNAKRPVLIADFTSPPWDASNKDLQMVLVEDHVWQCSMMFTNTRGIRFKIMDAITGRSYGGAEGSAASLPVSGTATEEGQPLVVNGPLNGEYRLAFNDQTLRFRFEKRALTRFNHFNIAGDFNGFSRTADPMHMVADHTWQADLDIEPRAHLAFFFLADGSLENQWGDAEVHPTLPARGRASEMAQSIKIETPVAGAFRFTFHEDTGEYSIEPLTPAEIAPPPTIPPPERMKEIQHLEKPSVAPVQK